MDGHEKLPVKSTEVQENEQGGYVNIHDGPRTEGTQNVASRVRRLFSSAQIFFFALNFMSSWEALGTNIAVAFWNGGPRAVVWGFSIVIPGVLCQVASLAEMASVQPIAGAQYHWTYYYAPARYRRLITWFQGWITWFSWIAMLAGLANIVANITQNLIAVQYPSYVSERWHTVLIMYAVLIVEGLVNQFVFWLVPWIELLAGALHIILFITFVCVLSTMGERKSSDFVFFEKSNLSGWNDDFVSFNLGIVLVTWGFVGFDGAVHMSEEVRKARHAVPRAMFWTICMNSVLAFTMTLVYFFFIGNVDDVLSAAYGLVPICINATGSVRAGSAMVGLFLITVVSVSLGGVASTSRITWAWSRDGALPAYFSYISPRHRIPVRSVWLPIGIVMLICLLNLASTVALGVIIALSTFGLYNSYFIAISCAVYARATGRIENGGWSLGRWGWPINIAALIYTAWISIFLVFPNYLPITAELMNYALPINVLVWIFALVTWLIWARHHWPGLNKAVVDAVVADSDRKTKE
ncbi:choline transport protein [Polyplosphaeria fusca]|uniref:Choline transport protein n=1 Tax=Polyplosphaeria fusca TaxID=682080 RepID=A0A9P4RCF0_9PLEO|nr:choline transport protein [Polyplosphaeria fusca]